MLYGINSSNHCGHQGLLYFIKFQKQGGGCPPLGTNYMILVTSVRETFIDTWKYIQPLLSSTLAKYICNVYTIISNEWHSTWSISSFVMRSLLSFSNIFQEANTRWSFWLQWEKINWVGYPWNILDELVVTEGPKTFADWVWHSTLLRDLLFVLYVRTCRTGFFDHQQSYQKIALRKFLTLDSWVLLQIFCRKKLSFFADSKSSLRTAFHVLQSDLILLDITKKLALLPPQHRVTYLSFLIHPRKKIMPEVFEKAKILNLRWQTVGQHGKYYLKYWFQGISRNLNPLRGCVL